MKRLYFLFWILFSVNFAHADSIVIGSKIFTESYVLSEIAAQTIERSCQCSVVRKSGLGNTGVLFESLKNGSIDVYPEYTGTIAETELKNPKLTSVEDIKSGLDAMGLTMSQSLGFDDTYALAVKDSFAKQYHLETMSDLKKLEKEIRTAFSYEFMGRKDGFEGMVAKYQLQLPTDHVKQMEHALVYKAIEDDAVDVIEVYSTDANILRYHLRVLKDDQHYFPSYQAVWVARKAFVQSHPEEWKSLTALENSIDANQMIAMNANGDIDKIKFEKIAADFLGSSHMEIKSGSAQVWQRTKEHLYLVGISLLFSILIGVPFGIVVARTRSTGKVILIGSAIAQTIPALALLCFLIPFLGIGLKPALVALCIYSLLPVVLNTSTGIRSVDPKYLETARALGLNPRQILTRITLPLASPSIMDGIKTATIVSIGTATLAALVGAGGYGALIISGLSLNDTRTILMGAIPAACMALVAQGFFEIVDRLIIPKGIQS